MVEVQKLFPIKRLLLLCMSVVCFVLSSLGVRVRRLARREIRGTCVVLYYHSIRSEHRLRFAKQMDALLRHAKPIRADGNILTPSVHHAVVTFDDGYQNVIDNALPELERRGIPFAFFVVTEALGKLPFWLTGSRDPDSYGLVASEDQIRRLSPELVTVGSHTLTHPVLPALGKEDAMRELSESRVKLEKMLARKIGLFSFPFGAHNAKLIESCREAGYERVFTTLPTLAFADPAEFVTGRVTVEPTDWPLEFRLKLCGAYRWMSAALALKRKLRSMSRLRARGGAQTVNDCSPSPSSGVN
jgi:peptidoglycan/xylan/chitin deacetylase (PgdA/CDA1 family)